MKLWGGRFSQSTAALMDAFNNSIQFDWQLYKQDIAGSVAHSKMLHKIGILSGEELSTILKGLEEILQDIESGDIQFDIAHEDIHMNIEALLVKRIGDLGKKVHTARSRNDQVALDFRLYVKEAIENIQGHTAALIGTLTEIASAHVDTFLPGMTHLQPAQPVRLAFHFLAYVEMLIRDYDRLEDARQRMDQLPLGAGALAGTSYETDRAYLAELLGFSSVTENAMDTVSDRDFAIEFLSAISIQMTHLSRLAEEIILWSSAQFQFVELSDAYATGSSIMPQKKNPDAAELVRGKAGVVYGRLMSLLAVMKSLPLAYNKDMQEDKVPVFETVKDVTQSLQVFSEMLKTATFNKAQMKRSTELGYLNATDAADYLVEKGLPFRSAHEVVGKLVAYAISVHKGLAELEIAEFKQFSERFDVDIQERLDIETCIEAKKSYGSTSKKEVLRGIDRAMKWQQNRR